MTILRIQKDDNRIVLMTEYAGQDIYTEWRAYGLGEIPKNFGCNEFETDTAGIGEWFNYKGLTYVRD
tara:strand:+ start:216 stop:416 length:201 start_codon:yes stop_codon:yes gene_type:complete